MQTPIVTNRAESPKPKVTQAETSQGSEPAAKAQSSRPVADFLRFTRHKLHEKQKHVPWSSDTWAKTLNRLKLHNEPKTSPLTPPTEGRARSNSLPKALDVPPSHAPDEAAAQSSRPAHQPN